MGRGRHENTRQLMTAIYGIAEERQPITVRGVAYSLFTRGLIDSMAKNDTARVSRVTTQMREEGTLLWEWIADETRGKKQLPSWNNPQEFMDWSLSVYRKSYWSEQPFCVEVWSEKSTVSGVLAPVLEEYAVAFRVQHGFGSATSLHEAAEESAWYPSHYKTQVLYVGDHDPSGLYMSQVDIPERVERYRGQVQLRRIALTEDDGTDLRLPYFPVESKRQDPRFKWWQKNNYGARCWELDAMDPRDLRDRVEAAISSYIDVDAWERCKTVERAEYDSMQGFFKNYLYS